ncbi:DUF5652 family protein [Candidatus Parcubacteria bacterium]|nr:DUF5652 family protein [Candidatus Parcubacteria bacterium]
MATTNILSSLAGINPLIIFAVIVWTLIWKGMALWRAAGLQQKGWFIALLLINTVGLLEIFYLFFTREYKVQVVKK